MILYQSPGKVGFDQVDFIANPEKEIWNWREGSPVAFCFVAENHIFTSGILFYYLPEVLFFSLLSGITYLLDTIAGSHLRLLLPEKMWEFGFGWSTITSTYLALSILFFLGLDALGGDGWENTPTVHDLCPQQTRMEGVIYPQFLFRLATLLALGYGLMTAPSILLIRHYRGIIRWRPCQESSCNPLWLQPVFPMWRTYLRLYSGESPLFWDPHK